MRPYPKEWDVVLEDGHRVFVGPMRPEDEDLLAEFFKHIAPEDLRLRFFAAVRDFSHAFIARLIQRDYARDRLYRPRRGERAMMGCPSPARR